MSAIDLDGELHNADWTKQTWDLPPRTPDELDAWLEAGGESVEEFIEQPRFKNALANTPWLKEWVVGKALTAAYVESEHPRDPGGEGGGQWVPKGTLEEKWAPALAAHPENDPRYAMNQEAWDSLVESMKPTEEVTRIAEPTEAAAELRAIEAHHQEWRDGLSEQERLAIKGYTGAGYLDVNNYMQGGEPLVPQPYAGEYQEDEGGMYSPETAASVAARLEGALERAPELPPDTTIYRVVSGMGEKLAGQDAMLAHSFYEKWGTVSYEELQTWPQEKKVARLQEATRIRSAYTRSLVTDEILRTMPVGTEITMARGAFQSATIDRGFAGSWKGADPSRPIFRVKNARSGALLDGLTNLAGESEVLVDPDVTYYVRGVSQVDMPHFEYSAELGKHVWRPAPRVVIDLEEKR